MAKEMKIKEVDQLEMGNWHDHGYMFVVGKPVICTRIMGLAVLVSSINPTLPIIDVHEAALMQYILWLLYEKVPCGNKLRRIPSPDILFSELFSTTMVMGSSVTMRCCNTLRSPTRLKNVESIGKHTLR